MIFGQNDFWYIILLCIVTCIFPELTIILFWKNKYGEHHSSFGPDHTL